MTSLISYAQNFEDVMLWRALKHVESGFYIDLGAHDPVVDSVSLAFHERGWRGIHVEPSPHYAQLLRAQRLGDTVIEAAVGNAGDMLTFFEIPDTGISTADPHIAQQHRERGFETREITVPCVRLSSIFKACGKQEIHWMKIDVEGFEWSALTSWDKAAARPWIVVVESTLPMTQIESHEKWEPILLRRGYMAAYFDGLNRYYVYNKYSELLSAFTSGPNVFDGFTFNGTSSVAFWGTVAQRYEQRLTESTAEILTATKENTELRNSSAENELKHSVALCERLAQLDARKDEVLRLEQARAQREEALGDHIRQQSQEKEELLRRHAAREQDTAAMLLDWQQKAEVERTQHHQRHSQRERELELRFNQLQDYSTGQLAAAQQQLENERMSALRQAELLAELQRQVAAREREIGTHLFEAQKEFSHQLAVVHRDALEKNASLAKEHAEQVVSLHTHMSERAREYAVQAVAREHASLSAIDILRAEVEAEKTSWLQAANAETAGLKQTLLNREREFGTQMLVMQKQAAEEERRLHAEVENRMSQLSHAHSDDLTSLRRETDAREKNLREQLEALQRSTEELRQEARTQDKSFRSLRLDFQKNIHRLRTHLMAMESTYSWRLTAPMRKVAAFFFMKKAIRLNADAELLPPPIASELAGNTLQEAFSSIPLPTPSEHTMHPTANKVASRNVSNADTVIELMTSDDHQFVQNAYRLVLGRDADADGTSEYLGQLQAGSSRLHILAQLRLSPEGNARATKISHLDDQLAVATNAKAIATTIEGLFALRGITFIRAAYLSLLGREPDSDGMKNCIAQLHSGAAKVEIMAQLVGSQEGRSRVANVQEISSAIRHHRQARKDSSDSNIASANLRTDNRITATPKIADLLHCDEQEFVRMAFWIYLGRWPDPEAFGICLKRLAEGVPRIQLLAEISGSSEAVNRYRLMTQVDRAIRHHRLVVVPIIGAVAQFFLTRVEKQDDLSRRLRALEFENALGRDPFEQRLSQTEFEIGAIKQQLLERLADLPYARVVDDGTNTAAGNASQAVSLRVASSLTVIPDMRSQELERSTSADSQGLPATWMTPLDIDPHVSEVLAELQSALAIAKKVSDENSY